MAKSKKTPPVVPGPGRTFTQEQRDRVASVLAAMLGLVTVSEEGRMLAGMTPPEGGDASWLAWYNIVLAVVSVADGAGLWMKQRWSRDLAVNILAFHAVVLTGLCALFSLGQAVAWKSMFAMLFRTFTWTVIWLLIRWRRTDN